MTELEPHDFARYFEAVHGHPPFPWQARLLERVVQEGRWPSLLDLPTGTGKTAAIDVALFHLALDASRPATERRAPLRIVMVVDRRTVVDQAFVRAKKIARALRDGNAGVLRAVRDRLCSLGGTTEPLTCAHLRGGMPRDDAWAKRPDQPVVAVSTVDQVGSRLLFRGYGVSDAMRPIHAGLLAQDTLFLLDEVHLSRPFLQTLEAVGHYRGWSKASLPDRWQFVAMSATPGTEVPAFGLGDADHQSETLARRLRASKPAETELVKVAGTEPARRAKLAEECAKRASALAGPGKAVAVVVNRVATALAVFALLKSTEPKAQVFLVTGRMRPLDRDDLDAKITNLVSSGRVRDPSAAPVIVVATQCIEAGADFDFDALVTECASLDALRQRFGRLNRLGEISDARGVVLVRSDVVGKDADDAVYGRALAETWDWLQQIPRDFGIQAMAGSLPIGEALMRMLPPLSRAPVMLPAHLDAWTQTTPIPRPDPDVSLWLHGVDQRPEADVQIVWRSDVSELLIVKSTVAKGMSAEETRAAESVLDVLLARVQLCAPSALEALSVPIGAARAWLAGSVAVDVTDVEGRSTSEGDDPRPSGDAMRGALLWKGDSGVVIDADGLRPGMTIVVPSTYGGLHPIGTWDPSSTSAVADLGDRARWQKTRRATLRIHPSLLDPCWPPAPLPMEGEDFDDDERERVTQWLDAMESVTEPEWLASVVRELRSSKRRAPTIVRFGASGADDDRDAETGYFGLVARTRAREDGGDATTEDDGASHTGVEVTLDEHMEGVRTWAERFAGHCGLPTRLTHDLGIAARWHDAGKVDLRFQRLLRGGSPLSDVATTPLAKSKIVAGDRATRLRARQRSGYPAGARHELSSVSLLEKENTMLANAFDRDLVLHLVASHHGWCRPLAPVVEDREPVDLTLQMGSVTVTVSSKHALAALDSGIAGRFWCLVERYGWFGLAWLEAILRLADHRRSEEEQSREFAEREST